MSFLDDAATPAGTDAGWVPPVASWISGPSSLDAVAIVTDGIPRDSGGLSGNVADAWPSIDGPSADGTFSMLGTSALSIPTFRPLPLRPTTPSIHIVPTTPTSPVTVSPTASGAALTPVTLAVLGVALYLLLTG